MGERKKSAVIFAGRSDDELVRLIEEQDMTLQQIAEKWHVSKIQLQRHIEASPERAARCREARKAAADFCDREAERVLRALKPDSTGAEIAKARELASHLRWRARVRDPAAYGDKFTVEQRVIPADLQQMSDAELDRLIAMGKPLLEGRAELVSVTETGNDDGAE